MNAPTQSLEQLAKTHLEDLAVNALLEQGRPLRSAELSEAAFPGTRVAGELWRVGLEGCARVIVGEDRRWDLAARRPVSGRTVDGMVEDLIRAANGPVQAEPIVTAISAAKGQSPESLSSTILNLLQSREKYVEMRDGRYALEDWFIDTSGGDEEDVVFENFLDEELGFEELRQSIDLSALTPGTPPVDVCRSVVSQVGGAVSFRALSFFCWKANPRSFDPRILLVELHAAADMTPLSPGLWCGDGLAKSLRSELLRQSTEAARTARPAAGSVADLDSLLAAKVPEDAAITLKPEEIEGVIRLAEETQTPVSLVSTLADVFETYPADTAFVPAAQAFASRFNGDPRFQAVGPGVWMLAAQIPPEAIQVPHSLEPVMADARTIENELIDALLEDPGLENVLQSQVRDPYWEDFGEEDEVLRVPESKRSGDELIYTVLHHHYLAGTMKLRQMDEGFLPASPKLQRLVVVDGQSGEHVAWANLESGVITGLKPLYEARLAPSGSTFRLQKTPDTGVVEFFLNAEPHAETAIDPDRLAELQQIAADERARPQVRTIFDLMMDLFILTPKGFDFYALWAELNVIRRTSKRLVASTLSSYPCFYARKGKANAWTFDDRKADQGRRRDVKKHMRK